MFSKSSQPMFVSTVAAEVVSFFHWEQLKSLRLSFLAETMAMPSSYGAGKQKLCVCVCSFSFLPCTPGSIARSDCGCPENFIDMNRTGVVKHGEILHKTRMAAEDTRITCLWSVQDVVIQGFNSVNLWVPVHVGQRLLMPGGYDCVRCGEGMSCPALSQLAACHWRVQLNFRWNGVSKMTLPTLSQSTFAAGTDPNQMCRRLMTSTVSNLRLTWRMGISVTGRSWLQQFWAASSPQGTLQPRWATLRRQWRLMRSNIDVVYVDTSHHTFVGQGGLQVILGWGNVYDEYWRLDPGSGHIEVLSWYLIFVLVGNMFGSCTLHDLLWLLLGLFRLLSLQERTWCFGLACLFWGTKLLIVAFAVLSSV